MAVTNITALYGFTCGGTLHSDYTSIYRSKRIHRGTWLHIPTGQVKRLDYILTRKYISRFITSCRAYRKASSLFDTDHYMVKMSLRYPTTNKKTVYTYL